MSRQPANFGSDGIGPKTVSRRGLLKGSGVVGIGAAAALAGLDANAATSEGDAAVAWDHEVDVVVVGSGIGGLSAGISAREAGASVMIVEANFDVGGRTIFSGGAMYLRGGNRLQKELGVEDSADAMYEDWTTAHNPQGRFNDREIVRTYADHQVEMFDFLEKHGVKFTTYRSAPDRLDRIAGRINMAPWPNETVSTTNGSGLVRPLEMSARRMGVEILLQHRMTKIHREQPFSGRVTGITVMEVDKWFQPQMRSLNIKARKGVVIATGGNTANVAFRTMFDVRFTEEYQAQNGDWSLRNADGEMAAMAIGAALGGTGNQTLPRNDNLIVKAVVIGKKYLASDLKASSPHFFREGAIGLDVVDFQDLILVKENGLRFYDETAENRDAYPGRFGKGGTGGETAATTEDPYYYDWNSAVFDWTGDPDRRNGGGPIWAIFDADAVAREKWTVEPPYVNLDGYFFSADTIEELASKVSANEYQWRPMPAKTLADTVARYNSFVDAGKDADFNKPAPVNKIAKPPFYAAWATPGFHDTYTGVRINKNGQAIDLLGEPIPGLYACGDSAGGFGQHGLTRAATFGRLGAQHAVSGN